MMFTDTAAASAAAAASSSSSSSSAAAAAAAAASASSSCSSSSSSSSPSSSSNADAVDADADDPVANLSAAASAAAVQIPQITHINGHCRWLTPEVTRWIRLSTHRRMVMAVVRSRGWLSFCCPKRKFKQFLVSPTRQHLSPLLQFRVAAPSRFAFFCRFLLLSG